MYALQIKTCGMKFSFTKTSHTKDMYLMIRRPSFLVSEYIIFYTKRMWHSYTVWLMFTNRIHTCWKIILTLIQILTQLKLASFHYLVFNRSTQGIMRNVVFSSKWYHELKIFDGKKFTFHIVSTIFLVAYAFGLQNTKFMLIQ